MIVFNANNPDLILCVYVSDVQKKPFDLNLLNLVQGAVDMSLETIVFLNFNYLRYNVYHPYFE